MSPRTKEKFEEIRESKRRKILDSAIECFATTGYHAVSISELAAHAGVSKGLMYNYFSSKDELLKVILQEITADMMELFIPGEHEKLERETLLLYFDRLFDNLKSNLIMWKMYMAIFSQPAVQMLLADEIKEAGKKPNELMEKYFREQGSEDPLVEMAFLSAITSGVIMEYIADPDHYPLDQIKEKITRLY
jgi:AcrR family transcriptional regulator